MGHNKKIAFGSVFVTTLSVVMGFQTPSVVRSPKTALKVAVDPSTVTKKDYEDICGVSFDDDALMKRLKATNYLYPKHVEVIEDIAPIAGEMVDDVVSLVASNTSLVIGEGLLVDCFHLVCYCLCRLHSIFPDASLATMEWSPLHVLSTSRDLTYLCFVLTVFD